MLWPASSRQIEEPLASHACHGLPTSHCSHLPPSLHASSCVPAEPLPPVAHFGPSLSEQGTLTWTNTGSLGGGGDLKLTARMKLDKDSMQQVGLGGRHGWGGQKRQKHTAHSLLTVARPTHNRPSTLPLLPPTQMPTLMISKNWDFDV